MRNRFLLLGLLFALICNVASAQTQDGYLNGKVTDKKTGETLSFANLRLLLNGIPKAQGQADIDGSYKLGPVSPGTYTLQVKYLGYADMEVDGIVIKGDKTVTFDVKMGTGADTSTGGTVVQKTVVVVHYKAPVFDKDNTTSGETYTAAEIKKLPTRSVSGIVATSAGMYAGADGLHGNGGRTESNVYYVDGIKLRSAPNLPKDAIEQIAVITGGVPAEYGDATGAITTITTKGPSSTYSGSLEGITSELLDPYGYNLLEGTFSGPLVTKYKSSRGTAHDSSRTILGFFLSGNGQYRKVANPPAIPVYQVNGDVLEQIKANPLRQSPLGSGFVPNAEFVTKNDLYTTKVVPNNSDLNFSFSGKLDFQPVQGIDITAGGTAEQSNYKSYDFRNILFNYENNGKNTSTTYRGFLRFRQFFKTNPNSLIKNAYYTIQADYYKTNYTFQDAYLKNNLWEYGYLGKFERHFDPWYLTKTVHVGDKDVTTNVEQGFSENGVTFSPADYNPVLANYTQSYFNNVGEVQSYNDLQSGGALLNGQTPPTVYSMWFNVGTNPGAYQKQETQQFTLYASGAANIKNHELKFGISYEERTTRSYTVYANNLWTLARQLTNQHLTQFDTANPIPVYDQNGNFQDTVNYNFQIAPGAQSTFDKNFRDKLISMGERDVNGKLISDQTLINIDRYDPSMFNMNMFSADELLNKGNGVVSYYGYDYLGNKVSGKHSVEEFLDPNKRTMGAYNPIYTAGYIQDKFEFKDLIFRVGLRVDRFDANQSVLKDQYSLYPIRTAGEVTSINNIAVTHPGNIGSNYAVYVDDVYNPTKIVGYRNGNTWYNASGVEIQDPSIIASETKSGGIQPYLVARNDKEAVLSRESFQDYKPQVNVMPRVSFSFPVSDNSSFYANYDVLTVRPLVGNVGTFDSYYFLQYTPTVQIANPDLKPEKRVNYEIGFKQKIGNQSALSLRAFYGEIRDMIQTIKVNYAYPISYTTLGNIDFGTVKGLTFGYDLKRLPTTPSGEYSSGITITSNYTLQFATGTGSNAASAGGLIASGYPNLRTPFPLDYDVRHNINLILDYRFGWGAGYSGPDAGFLKAIFENAGLNLQLNTHSGTPYTRQSNVTSTALFGVAERTSLSGTINGSRLPWQFLANLQVDKDLYFAGKRKNGNMGKGVYMNVYVWVQNLLNSKNVAYVYRYTGLPTDDGYLNSATGQQIIKTQVSQQAYSDQYSIKLNNPGNFVSPRLIRIGASINF